MVQLRVFGSLMLVVAATEDEYFHTQLLQTRLAVDDKKLLPEKAKLFTEAFEKHSFFARGGPGGPGSRPPPCNTSAHCSGACNLHYGPQGNVSCMQCSDKLADPDSPVHISQDDVSKMMRKDPDEAFKFIVDVMDNCTGDLPDLLAASCPQDGLFSCVVCSHASQSFPDDSPEFLSCVDRWEDMKEMMKQAGPGLIQTVPVEEKAPKDPIAELCGLMWPGKSAEQCKGAAGLAAKVFLDPKLCEEANVEEKQDCIVETVVEAMSKELGDCKATAACKEELGDNVDVDRCYEEASKCDSCGWDVSEDCKECVINLCEDSDDKCLKSSKDLLLAMKQRRSPKTIFALAHAKESFGKIFGGMNKN